MKLLLRSLVLAAPLALLACSEPPSAGGDDASGSPSSSHGGGASPGAGVAIPEDAVLFEGRVVAEGELTGGDNACFFVTIRYVDDTTPENGSPWLTTKCFLEEDSFDDSTDSTTVEFSLGPKQVMMPGMTGPAGPASYKLSVIWSPTGFVETSAGGRKGILDVELNDHDITIELPAGE